jgi:hypothetical protein
MANRDKSYEEYSKYIDNKLEDVINLLNDSAPGSKIYTLYDRL